MRRYIPPLVVSLFALFAAQPLFIDQLTCSDDSAFHIGRAVNLEALINLGHFFPRWSPYMAHGLGYPFFNYYAPLSSYVLVLLHKVGFIYPNALYLAFGLSLWLAGLATYALARDWFGEAAGVVAGVVYLTAPYFAYDILFRGNLAESFALLFQPLILFTLHRALWLHNKTLVNNSGTNAPLPTPHSIRPAFFTVHFFLTALAFAGLMYTHNATALAAAPLFAAYVALLAFLQKDWRTLFRGGLSLIFGLALSANFWVPALLETNLVQTDKLLVPPIFTYYTNYISFNELFAPPNLIDPLLINPSPAKALGLVTALLAGLGFVALAFGLWRKRSQSESLKFKFGLWLLVLGLGYCFMTLAISQPLWDSLPLIKFIQFPWRFLSLAMLCAALLAGAAISALSRYQWWAASGLIAIAVLGSLSWWYPRYCVPFQETTLATTIRYELDTATLGTTAKGEYLPRTVASLPDDTSLAQALIKGEQPQYLSGLPDTAALNVTQPDPLNYQASFTLPATTTLTYNQFFFPGWEATLDGQSLPLSLSANTGLITINVPAGIHILNIQFGNTPLHLVAAFISIIAIIFMIASFILLIRRQQLSFTPATIPTPSPTPLALLLLPLIFLFVRPVVIDRTDNPLHHSAFDAQSSLTIGQPLNLNLAGGLTVLSAEYPATVPSGGSFDVSAYLTVHQPLDTAYRPRFDLSDSGTFIWNNGNDALPPRWHKEPPETDTWPVGQYAQWSRHETILSGTPPGDYDLTATIFDRATLAPDSVIDENGTPVAPAVALGTVHVTRPSTPPALSDLNIQYPANTDFGPLTLLGYNLDRSEAQPGDQVLFTFFFRADEAMSEAHSFNLIDPSYPTTQWQVGDIWRFQTWGQVPVETQTGPYQFQLIPLTLQAQPLALTPIHVTAPQRTFTTPTIANPLSVSFGNLIELAGYEISGGNTPTITLLWHALRTPGAGFTAFVHVEDAAGHIVAQSDAAPANWSRPTTGWLEGEYVLDAHTLPTLPSGTYSIYAGLASQPGGARLATPQGDRAVLGVYKVP